MAISQIIGPVLPLLFAASVGGAPISAELAASLRLCKGLADAAARLACYDGVAAVLPVAGPSDVNANDDTGSTMRPSAARHTDTGFDAASPSTERSTVISSIAGRFDGWKPTTQFRLANGQVWQVVDGTSAAYWLEDPKVRVVGGALGAYYLRVDGTSISVRVRRLR